MSTKESREKINHDISRLSKTLTTKSRLLKWHENDTVAVVLHDMVLRWHKSTEESRKYVTCYHKISVKSQICIQRFSQLNILQNNRKRRKINPNYQFLVEKIGSYTHMSHILSKHALWRIWMRNNFE